MAHGKWFVKKMEKLIPFNVNIVNPPLAILLQDGEQVSCADKNSNHTFEKSQRRDHLVKQADLSGLLTIRIAFCSRRQQKRVTHLVQWSSQVDRVICRGRRALTTLPLHKNSH